MLRNFETPPISLENFDGPLEVLLHLVQKQEMDVCEVTLRSITDQYRLRTDEATSDLDAGAEFVGATAYLLWLKSKNLLPPDDALSGDEENRDELFDPSFSVIHHLVDYCYFKEQAKVLAAREEGQLGYYMRGVDKDLTAPCPLGIEHVSMEELSKLFEEAIAKASKRVGTIDGEVWETADKIVVLRKQLRQTSQISLSALLAAGRCKDELIVTFLATLELMKNGEIAVVWSSDKTELLIIKASPPTLLTPSEDP